MTILNNIIAIIVISFVIVGSLWGIGNLLNPEEKHTIKAGHILLIAENNFFNETNPTLYIHSNIPEKITIVNNDFVRHDFIVDELNLNTGYLYSGQDFTTAIVSKKPGTFEYYCSLHPATMQGKIEVR